MRVFSSGFNLYGQFIKCPTFVIDKFVDYSCDFTHLEAAHTFNVVVTLDSVFVHGSKLEETHQIHKLEDGLDVEQITCAETRIIILLKNGDLLKYDLEMKNLALINKDIIKVSCGRTMNIAVTKHGSVLNLPNCLSFKGNDVKDVVCGREHCVLLDELGKVYTFGRGSRGQLGHGCLDDELEPKLVEALDGVKINKIAAGGWHSCAVSADGDLYVWGWNGNGQLGLYSDEKESIPVMASPQLIDFEGDMDVDVIDVACGHRHTIALLDNKKLYGAGWNKYSQLGNVTQEMNIHQFRFIYDFKDFIVKELKCGPWSSLVICF